MELVIIFGYMAILFLFFCPGISEPWLMALERVGTFFIQNGVLICNIVLFTGIALLMLNSILWVLHMGQAVTRNYMKRSFILAGGIASSLICSQALQLLVV